MCSAAVKPFQLVGATDQRDIPVFSRRLSCQSSPIRESLFAYKAQSKIGSNAPPLIQLTREFIPFVWNAEAQIWPGSRVEAV